jgi:hypothetical protein
MQTKTHEMQIAKMRAQQKNLYCLVVFQGRQINRDTCPEKALILNCACAEKMVCFCLKDTELLGKRYRAFTQKIQSFCLKDTVLLPPEPGHLI